MAGWVEQLLNEHWHVAVGGGGHSSAASAQCRSRAARASTQWAISWCALSRTSCRHRLHQLNGLIDRLDGTKTYVLTPDGQRVALFYTRLQDQLLRPLLAADHPPAPVELRQALRTIDRHVQSYIRKAHLQQAT